MAITQFRELNSSDFGPIHSIRSEKVLSVTASHGLASSNHGSEQQNGSPPVNWTEGGPCEEARERACEGGGENCCVKAMWMDRIHFTPG